MLLVPDRLMRRQRQQDFNCMGSLVFIDLSPAPEHRSVRPISLPKYYQLNHCHNLRLICNSPICDAVCEGNARLILSASHNGLHFYMTCDEFIKTKAQVKSVVLYESSICKASRASELMHASVLSELAFLPRTDRRCPFHTRDEQGPSWVRSRRSISHAANVPSSRHRTAFCLSISSFSCSLSCTTNTL